MDNKAIKSNPVKIGDRFKSDGLVFVVTQLTFHDTEKAWAWAENPRERTGQWLFSVSDIRRSRVRNKVKHSN